MRYLLIVLLWSPFCSWSKSSSVFVGLSFVKPESEVVYAETSEPMIMSFQDVQSSIQPMAGFEWHIAGKHSLLFQWQHFQYNQTSKEVKGSSKAVDTFKIKYNLNLYQVSYAYEVWTSHLSHVQMLFGLHTVYHQYGFVGEPYYCHPITLECRTFDSEPEGSSVLRYLPQLGFNIHYELAKDWDIYWKFAYYDFKLGGYDDMLLDTDISLASWLFDGLYFHLGYRWSRLTVDRRGPGNQQNLITHEFFGPSATLYYYFSL